jgi:glycolate dehydrogenase FAD-binding subunit
VNARAGPSTGVALAAALADALGSAAVRAAAPADAVAGLQPALVVTPADEGEVAAALRTCSRAGAAVVPRGGGTALDWGAPPRQCDVVLSTERLVGIVDHAAADLVCVVRAGTRLSDLQAALARAPGHAQRLALDPPRPQGATVGGVLATDHAGGLRHRHGTPRDLLIGARFVLSDGMVAASGGRVVKNVAGYDLGRLLCGSLGSLAVIVEAAFKVHPLPAATRTVVLTSASPARLAAAAEAVRGLPAPVAGLDAHWPEGLLLVHLEGTAAGVAAGVEAVVAATGGEEAAAPEAEALQARLRLRPWDGPGAVAGIGVPLSRVAPLLEACSDFAVEAVVRAGVGSAEARVPVDGAAVAGFRAAVEQLGGHLTLRRGGSQLPGAAWPDGDPVALDLARSIKRSLDPTSTLPSGRRQGDV